MNEDINRNNKLIIQKKLVSNPGANKENIFLKQNNQFLIKDEKTEKESIKLIKEEMSNYLDNTSSCSSFSSSSVSCKNNNNNKNKSVAFIINKNSDTDESASIADSSFSSSSISSNSNEITTGKVKQLRDKFLNCEESNQFRRKSSEFVRNYQLKKCQSVIFNLEPSVITTIRQPDNIVKNHNHNHKRAQSNNCIDELYDDKIIETNESLIDESSVFDKCGVKERIRKFNNDHNNLKNQNVQSIRQPLNKKKYAGSCNNLSLNNKVIKQNNNNIKKKTSISSDAEVSNDDSNSTFSDDLTNSDTSCSHEFNTKPIKDEIKNYKSIQSLNYTSFDENYIKIKEAFNDLKKDNEQIESLIALVRSKVKEASVIFLDNYMVKNYLDTNEYENFSDESDDYSTKSNNLISNEMQFVRHKF